MGRCLTPEERRRAYELATLETRAAKSLQTNCDEGLHDRWRSQAEALGLGTPTWIAAVLHPPPIGAHRPDSAPVVAAVLEELTSNSSTWSRADVVRQVARRVPATIGSANYAREWIERVTEAVLVDPTVVRLSAPAVQVPDDLARRDGLSVYEPHGAARYTTTATLDVEQHALDITLEGRQANRALADAHFAKAAIEAGRLGDDQAATVRRLTLDGEAVACVVGPAGTGKTRTMGVAAKAWSDSGIAVRGLCLSAMAAGVLHAEGAIPSDTVAKFLVEQDRPGGPSELWQLRPNEVVVVDEAGMVASADLARIIQIAAAATAKVVLVGDYAQLGAIEAGGLFRLIARNGAAELSDVRRFESAWEAHVSLRLRERDPSVLDLYERSGRVIGGDRLTMIDEAFIRWQWARSDGESVVMCAGDHATVDALAMRAREARVAAGEVEAEGVTTSAQVIGVGDEIVTTRNERRFVTTGNDWVRNGDRWRVIERNDSGLVVESDNGNRALLSADYVRDDVALAYAVTVHKAQGITVDRCVLIVDEQTTAEALYVGMTRGRRSNMALVVEDDFDVDHDVGMDSRDRIELLSSALGRVSAEQAALDVLSEQLQKSESLATLAPRVANLATWITDEAPPDYLDELKRLADERAALEQRLVAAGLKTSEGTNLERHFAELDERRAELEAQQERLYEWIETHADTLGYFNELTQAADHRRRELGVQATMTEPAHVVDLIGPLPADATEAEEWIELAGRIEAYREEWSVDPDLLIVAPRDHVQYEGWRASVQHAQLFKLAEAADSDDDVSGISFGW